MKIFCQETEEHLKLLRGKEQDRGEEGESNKIVITSKLWAGEDGAGDRRKRALYEVSPTFTNVGYEEKQKKATYPPPAAKRANFGKGKSEAKASPEKQRHGGKMGSSQRPPRMTDREKIKQIRMRDKLPLYTPLRESNRGVDACPPAPTPQHKSQAGRAYETSRQVGSGASHRTNSTESRDVGARSAYYSGMVFPADRRLSCESSESEQSVSQYKVSERSHSRASTVNQPAPGLAFPPPPIFPPQNPFSHQLPFLPYPLNLASHPLGLPPVPPALSMLNHLSPPNLLQQNALVMPYPFILPLPLPVPVPLPILSDNMYLRVRLATSALAEGNKAKEAQRDPSPPHPGVRIKTEAREDKVHRHRDLSMPSQSYLEPRYMLDPRPMPGDDIRPEPDGAMDLSVVRSQSVDSDRPRPHSPSDRPPSPILIQPITSDESSNSSLPASQAGTSRASPLTRYSARRNLILDAPAPADGSPDKAAFDLYTNRKRNARLRVKTK